MANVFTISLGSMVRAIPTMIRAGRTAWSALSKAQKVGVLTAMGLATAQTASMLTDEQADQAIAAAAADASNDPQRAANFATSFVGALPSEAREQVIAEVNAAPTAGQEDLAAARATLIEAARAKASSIAATGDRVQTPDSSIQAYHAVRARISILRSALKVLGTSNPQSLRALRDAMFMDEDEFSAALGEL